MAYRRLPNTDKARIRSLRAILSEEQKKSFDQRILDSKLLYDILMFLPRFEMVKNAYSEALGRQKRQSEKMKTIGNITRMYISHYIQVLGMAIQRKELKQKNVEQSFLVNGMLLVPPLNTDAEILEVGRKLVESENQRIKQGGMAIYSPTIAKVYIHLDTFQHELNFYKDLLKNTNRLVEEIAEFRIDADRMILEAWNQIGSFFKELPREEYLMRAKEYGVVFYERKCE